MEDVHDQTGEIVGVRFNSAESQTVIFALGLYKRSVEIHAITASEETRAILPEALVRIQNLTDRFIEGENETSQKFEIEVIAYALGHLSALYDNAMSGDSQHFIKMAEEFDGDPTVLVLHGMQARQMLGILPYTTFQISIPNAD
jgi:hypothetical protein